VVLSSLTVSSEASEIEGLALGTKRLFSDLLARACVVEVQTPHEEGEEGMKDHSQRSVQEYQVAEEAAVSSPVEQVEDRRPGMAAAG